MAAYYDQRTMIRWLSRAGAAPMTVRLNVYGGSGPVKGAHSTGPASGGIPSQPPSIMTTRTIF